MTRMVDIMLIRASYQARAVGRTPKFAPLCPGEPTVASSLPSGTIYIYIYIYIYTHVYVYIYNIINGLLKIGLS